MGRVIPGFPGGPRGRPARRFRRGVRQRPQHRADPVARRGTLPAAQEEVRIRGVDIATVDAGGRIVDCRLYFDEMGLLELLGLLPPEPA